MSARFSAGDIQGATNLQIPTAAELVRRSRLKTNETTRTLYLSVPPENITALSPPPGLPALL